MEKIPGAILAGGAASRMGQDKAFTRVGGLPLLARAWNALAPGFGPLLLLGREQAPDGLRALPDAVPGLGPLGGIVTFLDHIGRTGAPGGAVLATDLPGVDASIMAELFARWSVVPDREARAVVLAEGDRIQPLVGIYGRGLAAGLQARLADTTADRSVVGWLRALGEGVESVQVGNLHSARGRAGVLMNVNKPDDIEVARTTGSLIPPMISVVGWKDSGKTTVAVELAGELRRRGYRVMAMKHGHGFQLDSPGTDSFRLRQEARAERVLLAGPDGFAIMGEWGPAPSGSDPRDEPDEAEGGVGPDGAGRGEPGPAELALRYLDAADVVVAEGWKHSWLPAVEVVSGDERTTILGADPAGVVRGVARCARGTVAWNEGTRGVPTVLTDRSGWSSALADIVESAALPGSRWARGLED